MQLTQGLNMNIKSTRIAFKVLAYIHLQNVAKPVPVAHPTASLSNTLSPGHPPGQAPTSTTGCSAPSPVRPPCRVHCLATRPRRAHYTRGQAACSMH